jgi:3-phosphoshikimate 1-carboxyvinyltransferase
MGLPELIEIVPIPSPVRAEVTVPGSKSITNRALVLAALSRGESVLRGALWSEDTQVMVAALQTLGFETRIEGDPAESSNRTIRVRSPGQGIPRGGTAAQPLELFVGNAGTAARFLTALVCLGQGVYRLHGVPRMHERPQAALFQALRELGYRIDSSNDKLPATVYGGGARRGRCRVSLDQSSQFASALLLCGGDHWEIEIAGSNPDEQPYVEMTRALLEAFPASGGGFGIEPDASSGSYFWAAGHLLGATLPGTAISVARWPASGWQIDARFPALITPRRAEVLPNPGKAVAEPAVGRYFPACLSREHDLGDSIMTAAVVAPFCGHEVRLTDLGRLRVQETERVKALSTELARCGAEVSEVGDTLVIQASTRPLHGAEIETYNDHRMAMCFAVLGLRVPGIKLRNPACVKKTFPNFFQKLATKPPLGLGVTLIEGRTGKPLEQHDLFAD